ncbi:MAG: copper-translocating P-type ATPase [Candidatus Wildermuthbacteria bacterium RIFCSPHIGHO2_01_FULL_49_22b]|uniref:Copper-translocating P-type ATPase n=1 Tax=Candidatus Wildermuthbacteria bacterium RIFCSPHIGHO2_01_FULL_49_22b TaxID=1802448 RepID=A0A1G2QVL9_9BACT|nr:MAG: copper-translocating P-type ATPase [Candidatus Wildermuthbacteria bacterium RIFCSPHIGHO2_01_FULL_49_22b]
MHPEVRQEKPGLCQECGMSLVKTQNHAEHYAKPRRNEHDKHAGHSTQLFLQKFWVSLALTFPIIAYSELPELFFGIGAPKFPGSGYLTFLFGAIIFFYGGWIFLAGAARELKARLPGMMTLIALAITAAFLWSVYATFAGVKPLFWELATLITIMLLGHWLEMKSVQGAQGALRELAKLLPDTAERIKPDGSTETVALLKLKEGDMLFVRPGTRIPVDGAVIEGRSQADESMITGESKPVSKTAGKEVIAGTLNGDGSLKIRVAKLGERTFLAGVMRLVAEAQASKSRLQILSDKAALYLTIIATVAGSVTLVAWLAAGAEVAFAVARLVAVFVIACPHALGLAVPLVASISTTKAAQNGFLVRQRLALEAAREIDIVLFDKTGTLTKGSYGVTKVIAEDEDFTLQLAASVDRHSEHFVSKAIVREAEKRGVLLRPAEDFKRIPGKGVRGIIDGKEVFVGGEVILEEMKGSLPKELQQKAQEAARQGQTIIYVIQEGAVRGAIALADLIREESREAVSSLKKAGIKTAMLTGDSKDVAQWVAGELGIDEYFARVLPGEKAKKVKILQNQGMKVAMVGDGINDAPALTQADLGIAIGAGTNVAIESAGIILVRNDPRDIAKIIRLSRMTYSKMLQNLFWATGYNVVALPLAAGALAFQGILLEPALAAIFMSLSTVIVAFNALLLRRATLE